MVSLQVSAAVWEQNGLGEGLGTRARRVQPLPRPWLESLIQEAPSCPAVLGCGSIWGTSVLSYADGCQRPEDEGDLELGASSVSDWNPSPQDSTAQVLWLCIPGGQT